jgi:uroporphyrinogen-III synthase
MCQSRGWDVLEYPCIGVDIVNTELLRQHLAVGPTQYAWLVITSSNAVDAIEAATANGEVPRPPLACVGAATALYAEQRLGQKVAFIPSEATGIALATQLPVVSGDRVLLPQSAIANPETLSTLLERGLLVDAIPAYSLNVGFGGDAVPNAVTSGMVDAVVVTSPSALDGFLTRMDAAQVPLSTIKQLVFAPIGPTTAKAIAQKCLQSLAIPTEHSLEGIIDVLACYFDRLETPNETVQT